MIETEANIRFYTLSIRLMHPLTVYDMSFRTLPFDELIQRIQVDDQSSFFVCKVIACMMLSFGTYNTVAVITE